MRIQALIVLMAAVLPLAAQGARPKDVRETAKAGAPAIPKLQDYLKDPDRAVRLEAARQITDIGTARSLDALIVATRDNDPEVQMAATDGLVNFYLPGYVKTGIGASLRRVGSQIKSKVTDTDDRVIEPYVVVRPEVISALGSLASGGGSMESRANAARAIGILRGKAAVADLLEAARSKAGDLIYESLIALQKIGDQSAAPRTSFLLNDLDPKVQVAAIETTGLLHNQAAVPDLTAVLQRTSNARVKRAALTAIAMLPDQQSRPLYVQYLNDSDEKLRAAAAEGLARLHNPADLPALQKAWDDETKTAPRLSLAFAQVMLGRDEVSEFSPLQFLINNLNSVAYKGVALPLLTELARDGNVRAALYPAIPGGTKDEKIGLARVLAASGDQAAIPELQKLSNDPDAEVAQEGLRALRTLQARF